MTVDLSTLKLGLIFFWAVWLTIVVVTNIFDGLKALGLLPEDWSFASGNFKYVAKATSLYSLPRWLTGLLFTGAVIWEGVSLLLFWRAFQSYRTAGRAGLADVSTAFGANLALWAAFMLADEIFRTYQQQTSHLLLFIAQMLSLLAIHLLPA